MAIHRCAGLLGFHNLETSCFDFLLPKFLEGSNITVQEARRRRGGCCQGSGTMSHQSLTVPSDGNLQINFLSSSRCPKSLALLVNPVSSGREQFCLQTCGPNMSPLSLGGLPSSSGLGVCPILAMPCPGGVDRKPDPDAVFSDRDILGMEAAVCPMTMGEGSLRDCPLSCELPSHEDASPSDLIEATVGEMDDDQPVVGREDPGLDGSVAVEGHLPDSALTDTSLSDPTLCGLTPDGRGYGERSSVEREVAEHLAKGFWPDLYPSQTEPLPSLLIWTPWSTEVWGEFLIWTPWSTEVWGEFLIWTPWSTEVWGEFLIWTPWSTEVWGEVPKSGH
ncbi:unnamed protein product, partial [Oncorhynchus mykiss]